MPRGQLLTPGTTTPERTAEQALELAGAGRTSEAIALLRRALAERPEVPAWWHNLAHLERAVGHLPEAEAAFRAALALAPSFSPALTGLGNLCKALGRHDEAITLQRAAVAANPSDEGLWRNLRLAYEAAGRLDESVAALTEAARAHPHVAAIAEHLAAALVGAGRFDEALLAARQAIALAPASASARLSAASALRERGEVEGAIGLLEQAVSLAPEDADGHWNLGLARLQRRFDDAGWAELEWRHRIEGLRPRLRPSMPVWSGEPLAGRTLRLVAEQGLGDTLQLVRYAAHARALGAARVIMEAQPAIVRLLRGADGVDEAVPLGTDAAPAPDEAQVGTFSLPRLLGPAPDRVHAAPGGYLRAEAALVARWRERLASLTPPGVRLRIGVGWQGNPKYRADARRSIPLAELVPLARLPGVQLYSLQKGHGTEQLGRLPSDVPIVPLGPELDLGADAFVDTAAVASVLDLVVSSDTALPHLAGALGCEVFLLLAHVPDWRWGTTGDGTPWYPRARVFRQPGPGDWAGAVAAAVAALRARLG